ncbi:MAG: phosphotransferase [Candidatus Poribacteria bacterium]
MMDRLAHGDRGISSWLKKSKAIISVTRLPGDASTRRYYRIKTREKNYVAMRTEPFSKQGIALPFLAVQRHLYTHGVCVPDVYEVDAKRGFILLEDLGDVTMLRRLQEASDSDIERTLYEQAIDQLVHLQVKASTYENTPRIEAFDLRFDFEKLMWEVGFTIEHFYKRYLKRTINEPDLNIMRDGFSEISTFLEKLPVVLTHRDFHSRNIMITQVSDKGGAGTVFSSNEKFVLIDFQDARMGPAVYDLASLLRDSYYQLEECQVTRLIDYYLARWEAMTGNHVKKDVFIYSFDMMAIQRNFKAIGSFASFLNHRGDTTYLKYIGNTFENIRRTLLKYPKYSALREGLFHYYYF